MSTVKANEYRHLNNTGTEPNLTLDNNSSVEVGNNLTVPQGNINVSGNTEVEGNLIVNGSGSLGDAATDIHTVTGSLSVSKPITATEGLIGDVKDTGGNVVVDVGTANNATFDGNLTGDVEGNIKGDVKSPNGTVILNNGTGAGTDSTFSGNAATATKLATARNFTISGDVTATAQSFDGSGNVTLTTAMANNSVDLGTHTTGNYVATIAAGQVSSTNGITVTGSGSEGAAVTIKHADTSSASSSDNSGTTFIQDITIDTYGHITAIGTGTATDTNTTELTVQSSIGGNQFTSNQIKFAATGTVSVAFDSSTQKVTFDSPDTLGGQNGSYYLNATNLNSGTVAQARGGTGSSSIKSANIVTTSGSAGTFVAGWGTYKINAVYIESNGSSNRYINYQTHAGQGLTQSNNSSYNYLGMISDQKWKENIQDSSVNALSVIDQLEFKSFDWKEDSPGSGSVKVGLIAQDVESIITDWVDRQVVGDGPELLPIDENGNFLKEPDLVLSPEKMTLYMLKAIQELSTKVNDLTNRVAALEG